MNSRPMTPFRSIVVLAAAGLTLLAQAATVYVSPTGTSGAAGTFANPYDLVTGLAKGSGGVNVGSNETWMAGARDIRNRKRVPRIVNGTVDIGCYEFRAPLGLTLFVR